MDLNHNEIHPGVQLLSASRHKLGLTHQAQFYAPSPVLTSDHLDMGAWRVELQTKMAWSGTLCCRF